MTTPTLTDTAPATKLILLSDEPSEFSTGEILSGPLASPVTLHPWLPQSGQWMPIVQDLSANQSCSSLQSLLVFLSRIASFPGRSALHLLHSHRRTCSGRIVLYTVLLISRARSSSFLILCLEQSNIEISAKQ